MIRASGMSPSPGTRRSGVESVPIAKSLTCTRRITSIDSRDRLGEPALGPARVHLHAHAGAEPAREVDDVAQRVHEPDVDPQRVRVLDRERDAERLRLDEHRRERGLERVGGLVPRQRAGGPGREHDALGADARVPASSARTSRSRCCSHCAGSREHERAEPDEVRDA